MLTRPAVPGTGVAGGDVSVALGDGIGTITFSHPKSNSLPAALLRRLAEAITWVGKDPAARVIVLRSGGTGPFCAGPSFAELADIAGPEQGGECFRGVARAMLA